MTTEDRDTRDRVMRIEGKLQGIETKIEDGLAAVFARIDRIERGLVGAGVLLLLYLGYRVIDLLVTKGAAGTP